MYISSKTVSNTVPSFEEYESCLKACFSTKEDNEIWCAQEEGGHPCLSILLKGEQAVVNYFAEEGGDMAVSIGNEDAEEPVEFCGGEYEIAGYQVIPSSDALKCALAFFHSQEMPDCIDWEEL